MSTIHGREWIIVKDDQGQTIDIRVEITREQYSELHRKLHDPKATFENTSSLDLLRNGFAKARGTLALESYESHNAQEKIQKTNTVLDILQTNFVENLSILNQSINGNFEDPTKKIDELTEQIEAYQTSISYFKSNIVDKIKSLKLSDEQKKFILDDMNRLINNLEKNAENFKNQITNLPKPPSTQAVAFVGIGYAIGYMPQIPVIPSSIPGSQFLTGYGTFINAITAEAHAAQAGVMPFTSLEYGFLGFKTMLLINNMLANGRIPKDSKDDLIHEVSRIIKTCEKQKLLDPNNHITREQITLESHDLNISNDLKNQLINLIMQTREQLPQLKESVNKNQEKIKNDRDMFTSILDQVLNKSIDPPNPFNHLKKAIEMFSDSETPITFPPNRRKEAIQCYNHLSKLFNTYNANNPEHKIPKENYLQAFRNKHIATGSNNFVRLLSFCPGYPIRFLWREAQLRLNPDNQYIQDKIHASREKDVALRQQWTGIFRNAGYALMNLVSKSIKGTLGFLPTIGLMIKNINISPKGLSFDSRSFSTDMEKLGRFLNVIALQDSLSTISKEVNQRTGAPSQVPLALSNLHARSAQAAHIADSNYDNLQHAGDKVMKQLERPETKKREAFAKNLAYDHTYETKSQPKHKSKPADTNEEVYNPLQGQKP